MLAFGIDPVRPGFGPYAFNAVKLVGVILIAKRAIMALLAVIPSTIEMLTTVAAIQAIWPGSKRSNSNVKAFVDYLRELFPNPAPWDVVTSKH